jgi:DNA (cytosine-5)-methyltransferase 1
MAAYYNEIDPKAAAWLRELIREGRIAPGEVDERSVKDVGAADLAGFAQCHFFAGIGGWSYALRLAGVRDDYPVWTGSCPCQPFSAAGQRGGTDDARHLWPEFYRLILKCRPPVVFGEQVASKDGLNWLDIVSTDLERADYAVGAADLCAAGFGAPHIRQRLYFVADDDDSSGRQARRQASEALGHGQTVATDSSTSVMGHAHGTGSQGRVEPRDGTDEWLARPSSVGDLEHAESDGRQQWRSTPSERRVISRCWESAEFIPCTDGKARPIEPGTFPLAHGVPHRVGLLRGYGNAIVAPLAAAFIESYLEL